VQQTGINHHHVTNGVTQSQVTIEGKHKTSG